MKIKFINILLLLSFISLNAYGQAKQSPKKTVSATERIEFSYEIGNDDGQEILNKLGDDTINVLLAFVEKYGDPNVDSIFKWKKSTPRLAVNKIHLVFTTANDPTLKEMQKKSGSLKTETVFGDAMTVLMSGEKLKKPEIFLFIFLDKLYYDQKKQERKDGNARFITAIAHEIYGNVSFYLKMNPDQVKNPSELLRAEMEVNAFQKGIEFLQRAIKQLEADKILPEMVAKMKTSLVREKAALAGWKKELEKLKKK